MGDARIGPVDIAEINANRSDRGGSGERAAVFAKKCRGANRTQDMAQYQHVAPPPKLGMEGAETPSAVGVAARSCLRNARRIARKYAPGIGRPPCRMRGYNPARYGGWACGGGRRCVWGGPRAGPYPYRRR